MSDNPPGRLLGGPASEPEIVQPDPRQDKHYPIEMTPFRQALTPLVKGFFRLITETNVEGSENLPAEGPVIVAANHLTNYDVFPMQFALSRPIFYMGKEELFRTPAMDWLLRQLGAFPVQRGRGDEWAMQHARKILDQGQVLGIFPEGTRSKSGGLRSGKTGAARLAIAASCPITPMAIHGVQRLFKDFPSRTPVRIQIGPPLYPQPGEKPLALTDRLMFTLAEMLPPEARGVYSQRPAGF